MRAGREGGKILRRRPRRDQVSKDFFVDYRKTKFQSPPATISQLKEPLCFSPRCLSGGGLFCPDGYLCPMARTGQKETCVQSWPQLSPLSLWHILVGKYWGRAKVRPRRPRRPPLGVEVEVESAGGGVAKTVPRGTNYSLSKYFFNIFCTCRCPPLVVVDEQRFSLLHPLPKGEEEEEETEEEEGGANVIMIKIKI